MKQQAEFQRLILCSILLFTSFVILFVSKASYADNKDTSAQRFGVTSQFRQSAITYPKEISELRGIHDITFSWQSVPGAAGYHFVLARDRAFKHIIREITKADGNPLFITHLDYGIYYVKVSPVAKDGTEGPFSDTVSFAITLPPPEGDY
jgi:hypothetical protein